MSSCHVSICHVTSRHVKLRHVTTAYFDVAGRFCSQSLIWTKDAPKASPGQTPTPRHLYENHPLTRLFLKNMLSVYERLVYTRFWHCPRLMWLLVFYQLPCASRLRSAMTFMVRRWLDTAYCLSRPVLGNVTVAEFLALSDKADTHGGPVSTLCTLKFHRQLKIVYSMQKRPMPWQNRGGGIKVATHRCLHS